MIQSLKRQTKLGFSVANSYRWRLRAMGSNSPRFSGAYGSREQATRSVRTGQMVGYDHDDVAEISFEAMCKIAPWDYAVLFWLQKLLRSGTTVLDAGGHMGTKFIAFQGVLDLSVVNWTVCDLEAIIRVAKTRQKAGELPPQLNFTTDPKSCGDVDILLASGLLQYLDVSFVDFLGTLAEPPKFILLNKVALRKGDTIFTIEKIGAAKVPYQIRSCSEFSAEISSAGYRVRDEWEIPELGHVIATHPLLGQSQSCGFLLERET